MNISSRTKWCAGTIAAAAVFAGAFLPVQVDAHDPRLDDADALLEKAIIVLEVAITNDEQSCDNHRLKAIQLLEKARSQIAGAAVCADEGVF